MAKDNRTEKATPRRREKAREKGQLARSREVPSLLVFAGAFLLFVFLGSKTIEASKGVFRHLMELGLSRELTPANLHMFLVEGTLGVIKLAGPIAGLTLVLAIVGYSIQGGMAFSFAALQFNVNKFNPVANLGKIFSLTGLVQLVKSCLIFLVIAYISFTIIKEELVSIPSLVFMPIDHILIKFCQITYRITIRIILFLVVLAVADYLYQRYNYEETLKMTKQEIKDEHKEMEGSPEIKGKIKRMQRDLARRKMLADVPKADVVITNPTEYAVALSYNMADMEAPHVVAKGKNHLARKIREIATAHRIPIVENRPLAQALYKNAEIGQSIPISLYKAVAEILAYVYKARSAQ